MTAEVEALLARLDDISSRSGHEWNAAKDAAALIRAQVEEIARLRDELGSVQMLNDGLRQQIAAAAQPQEPVAWRHRFFNPAYDRWDGWHYDEHQPSGTNSKLWQYEPLYAAPIPVPTSISNEYAQNRTFLTTRKWICAKCLLRQDPAQQDSDGGLPW
jgi:hypothetical protein